MKHIGFTTLLVLVAIGLFVSGCGEQKPATEKAKVENLTTTPADIKKEAKDLAKTSSSYLEEQKQLYMQEVLDKVAPHSQKMAELNSKVASLSEQAKAEIKDDLANFYIKMGKVAEKVGELQTASTEAYLDLKKGVENSVEEMDKAYDKVMSRF